ncbi:MAG: 50S ribosomal protein L6 [Geminicoccus sp.]|jgi:large subunit ribosomal protein L6|nr:50S ribosomal protein L6 [Geminicoccus sp.]MEC7141527.1 50S ribosomal protein L6 [Pseudomonadota bacterium]MEC8275037.1 50S ribosomal protein L6 [Pseudomonadota bacterium]HCI00292.1 50S ribosomal protein L6 [Alphaproteobacteria bacterium]|tara:strand:- start:1416 stop:1949 length:534 start_codon:yes stop_codon:yes gene_type:complete
MSRIGKNPVPVPAGVEVSVSGQEVKTKGKLGELQFVANSAVEIKFENGEVSVSPRDESRDARAQWGTARARIANMVTGVSEGFSKELELVGVGYRAALKGKDLQLQLGFSHDVLYPIPDGVKVTCEKPTSIKLEGADKQEIGQMAAEIRAYRPPEPYKGKGIRYVGEYIARKEGKKK